jgi:hypothetical protein
MREGGLWGVMLSTIQLQGQRIKQEQDPAAKCDIANQFNEILISWAELWLGIRVEKLTQGRGISYLTYQLLKHGSMGLSRPII